MSTIRKIFFVSLWLVIGGGIIMLLAAAMHKQKNETCRDYTVRIKGAGSDLFIGEVEIVEMLHKSAGSELKGIAVSSLNLHELEKELERNTWVEDAEIYLDSKAVLHVIVTEKKPIARIFTTAGNSYYIDSALRKLPLSDKVSAKVPVFTGFPERKNWLKRDSLLVKDVRQLALFILHDNFWQSQVSQIDITADREFEMIPLIGRHVVRLGTAEKLEKKFDRLLVFYKKVVSQSGFNSYPLIDIRYDGQVIATRTNEKRRVDSLQLRRNVEKLLRSGTNVTNEISDTDKNNSPKNVNPSVETTTDPNSRPTESSSGRALETVPVTSEEAKKDEEKRVPKAVMPKRKPDENKQQE